MRLVLITVIALQLLTLEGRVTSASALPQVPSTDPCDEAPCGKGAECKSMGSIAICVCPNDGTGDPFVSCMQQVENEQGSSTPSPSSHNQNQFVASFDVGSVHDKARSNPTGTVVKTSTAKPSITTRSTTTPSSTPSPSSSSTTTTRSPYVHVFDSSTSRPATVGHGHGSHGQNNDGSNQPESHRIPIINQNNHNNGNNHYSDHDYPPRPMNGGSSTYTPNYPYRGGSGSSSSSYELFNEKTVAPGSGPIADYGGGNMGGTTPYVYRGTATHLSGSNNAYEYDSRPITPTTSSYHYQHHAPPHSNNHNMDRYGHHSYHPSSSGFPDPITESSASYSRYATSSSGGTMGSSTSRTSGSGSGSSYDIYNYNQLRNDLSSHGHHGAADGFDRVADPMGKYNNCRSVNGIVVCADNTNAHGYHHSRDPAPLYDRGEMKTTTMNNYGFHTTRDRDHYSAYYPSRYGSSTSSTSHRPMSDYPYNVNRQGYPYDHDDSYHGSRQPIDSSDRMGASTNSYYPHTFLPKEQRISAQSTLTISSSSSSEPGSTTTTRNDNHHPLCKSMCGINSVCRLVLERPVCGCAEGHTGDPSVRCSPMLGTSGGSIGGGSGGRNGDAYGIEQCQRHIDCKQSEICAKNKCMDPCKEQGLMSSSSVNFIGVGGGAGGGPSICGTNAECLVVGHTPVCKCHQGFFGNPYVACVA